MRPLLMVCALLTGGIATGQAFADAPAGPDMSQLRPPAPFIREGTFNQDPQGGKLKGKLLRIKRPLLIVHD
nr:hypothetical protein [Steroidobacteraceae bacterium]